jgi:F0F1-type ATP synthase membrane subunit b/b'
LLSINYTAVIPVLTKAIQEQQALIEANQTTIQKQQEQIDELKALLMKLLNDK